MIPIASRNKSIREESEARFIDMVMFLLDCAILLKVGEDELLSSHEKPGRSENKRATGADEWLMIDYYCPDSDVQQALKRLRHSPSC
ncbi:hypothetical protein Nepgr_033207 [Nepenthes gracilis]|uniref:Uncharacterized protein n=1 Tax=Nepenthes gracilis TaxID=150966 RepID=A0AAD3Y8I0_NEPGR|nr:hypothetical protein Nepgr_033207 [Nepenthes gracilis]